MTELETFQVRFEFQNSVQAILDAGGEIVVETLAGPRPSAQSRTSGAHPASGQLGNVFGFHIALS